MKVKTRDIMLKLLTFRVKYNILLLHLKKCDNQEHVSRLWMARGINDSNREMLVAYGWCEL